MARARLSIVMGLSSPGNAFLNCSMYQGSFSMAATAAASLSMAISTGLVIGPRA